MSCCRRRYLVHRLQHLPGPLLSLLGPRHLPYHHPTGSSCPRCYATRPSRPCDLYYLGTSNTFASTLSSPPNALRLVWRLCVLDGMTCVVVRRVRRVSGVWMVLSRRLDSSSRRSLVSSDSSFGLTGGLRALWDPLQGRLSRLRHPPPLHRQCYHNQRMWCSGVSLTPSNMIA